MNEFTTVVGVDEHHVKELEVTWPTWKEFKPELLEQPLQFICDEKAGSSGYWLKRLGFVDHPNKTLRMWSELNDIKYATQREKMLTAITVAASLVDTEWYLKLDTDTWATENKEWRFPEWFQDDVVFTSSSWGYTKPAQFIHDLDEWAKGIPELCDRKPPVSDLPDDLAGRVSHKRIISFVFFGRTEFTEWALDLLDDPAKLPCPSQDTFLWYVAARSGQRWLRAKMKNYGWDHKRVKVK